MIRRRAELDTTNPPGQIVNRPKPTHVKTLDKEIDDWNTVALAKELYEIWKHAPNGSDVFVLMAKHARKDK